MMLLLVKRHSLFLFPAGTRGEGAASAAPRGAPGGTGRPPSRLDISDLEKDFAEYFQKGLADSSHWTYRFGENHYLRFC